ncbi:hypothetical protein A9179_01100 [Pseudomonas alcaligenes]|uniref:Uncharacterized protein n=1 Tax=Aquipseudomonas alcaligenes TaxID=43263 RepID=A0ABR7RUL2_AQUAC|nr:hypothetical protein [Pseudomonas alcaligenes]MBC9248862.1 hypothetical protein [Pseudomonas alcaligenes]
MNMADFPARLLPYERLILAQVGAGLPARLRQPFAEQVQLINKVQRLLDWREVEFYRMRWLRVNWPAAVLFDNREEFILGSGLLSAGALAASVSVWAVGGHVFSIEADTSLKPFRNLALSELHFTPGQPPEALTPD